MNNYFSNLGVTNPSTLSLSNQIALQQLKLQKKQEEVQQSSESSNIIGAEFLKSGLEKIGKGAAAKTGFSSLGNLGANIRSKGFTAGLKQTVEDARKEAIKKGTAFGQEQIDDLTTKAKTMLSKNAQGRLADAQRYAAGKKNVLDNLNKDLQNRGLPTLDPDDLSFDHKDVLQKIQQNIKDKQGVKSVTDDNLPTREGSDSYQPDLPASATEDEPKFRFTGQDYSKGKSLNEPRLADVQAQRVADDVATEENLVTGKKGPAKVPELPAVPDDVLVDGLPDEEDRVLKLTQNNFFKDLQAGKQPIIPESLGGPRKKLVQDAASSAQEAAADLPQNRGVKFVPDDKAALDNSKVPATTQVAQPAAQAAQPSKKLPSTQQEAKYLDTPDSTPSDASPERVLSDQSKLVDVDNSLDSRLAQLSTRDQATIKAGYGAGFERNVGALPAGQARNEALSNNINIKKQALKENAPELLDDTVYENSSRAAYMDASKAKTSIVKKAVNNLSPEKRAAWSDSVKNHPQYTNTADIKDLKENDFDAYRKARNTNQDIREGAFNEVNFKPEPQPASAAQPQFAAQQAAPVQQAAPESSTQASKPDTQPAKPNATNDLDDDDSGGGASTLVDDAAKGTADDAAKGAADDAAKGASTVVTDIAETGVEDVIGGLFEGGLGVAAMMILPSLFESGDSSSKPIVAPPPTISQTATFGQGR